MQNKILFLHGKPGTGKTTLANKITKITHGALLSQDYFLFQMNGISNPEKTLTHSDYVLSIKNMFACMKNFIQAKRFIVIEGSLVSISKKDPEDITLFLSEAKKAGYETVVITLKTTEKVRMSRMKKRGYVVPKKIDTALSSSLKKMAAIDDIVLDTTEKDIDFLVSEILLFSGFASIAKK